MEMKKSVLAGVVAALFSSAALAAVPAGYPADYQKIVDAGTKEGKVVNLCKLEESKKAKRKESCKPHPLLWPSRPQGGYVPTGLDHRPIGSMPAPATGLRA